MVNTASFQVFGLPVQKQQDWSDGCKVEFQVVIVKNARFTHGME